MLLNFFILPVFLSLIYGMNGEKINNRLVGRLSAENQKELALMIRYNSFGETIQC